MPFFDPNRRMHPFVFDTDGNEGEGDLQYIVTVKNALYFRRAFFNSVSLLADNANWQGTSQSVNTEPASLAGASTYASIQEYVPVAIYYPRQAEFFYDSVEVTHGGSLNTIVERNQWYGTFSYQLNAAINDAWTRDVLLAAGQYTVTVYYSKNSYGGTLTLYADGASLGTLNTYNSTSQLAQKETFSLTVIIGGRVVISGAVTGKQAQSTGYRVDMTKITIS